MKRFSDTLLSHALTAMFGATVSMGIVNIAHATEWRLASGYSDTSFHTQNLRDFAHEVETLTAGSLKISIHSNNSLVKLADIRAALESGKIEAGEVIMTGLAKEIPIAGADSVPFVVSTYADAERLWDLQRPMLERELAARSLVVAYSVPWPSQGLYTSRPITKRSDFSGNKMRTYNATTVRIAEMLGASPVDVPMVDVASALASGRMDSMISSSVTGVENKVWSHLKYFYEINAWTPKNAVIINQKSFLALTPNEQRAIRVASANAERRGWSLSKDIAASALKALKDNGIRIERMPTGIEREFTRLGERFSKEWIRTAGPAAGELFTSYFLRLPIGATNANVATTTATLASTKQ
jgi:TRAP-type transport system periplasmic protein